MNKILLSLFFIPFASQAMGQSSLPKPVSLPATSITSSGFNANWKPVSDAEAYCVYVYDKKKAPSSGDAVIADEGFSGVTEGSIVSPVTSDEPYVDLSEYGYAWTFGWSAYGYPQFVAGMVGGLVYSPYLDLRGNNGRYSIVITSYCNDGDTLLIETNGSKGALTHKVCTHVENGGTGMSIDTVTCDDGSKDLFFSVVDISSKSDSPDYFDRIQVLQNLEPGTEYYNMVASDEALMAKDETTGAEVTTKRFAKPSQYTSDDVLYYDLYAAKNDSTRPSSYLPYTTVRSEYSSMVEVDLAKGTSQVLDTASADTAKTDSLSVGDYAADLESGDNSACYNGSYYYTAPTTLYLKHTGSQIIYTKYQLAAAAGKEITALKFIYNNAGCMQAYPRTVGVKMMEVEDKEFQYDNDKQAYLFLDDSKAETVQDGYEWADDLTESYSVNGELIVPLSKPFAYTGKKNLLVSITFDGTETCGSMDLSFFYVPETMRKAMTFTSDEASFAEYHESADWPKATSSTGTKLEQPVTQFVFRTPSTPVVPTGIEQTVNGSRLKSDNTVYNIMGQKVGTNYHGIVIRNHKKILMK